MDEDVSSHARTSPIWAEDVIEDIHIKAGLGTYRMHGFSTLRDKFPTLNDLVFLPAVLSRFPLEGYKERCETRTVIGESLPRPLDLAIPIMIAGMSYGALSKSAKLALGHAASRLGISTTTGDGGMLWEEREASAKLIYQVLSSRYGHRLEAMLAADALEIVVSQGAKPGTGGVLFGAKIPEAIAAMRTLPSGIDQRGPARHPDWLTAPDLAVKIEELREITDGQIPVIIKMGASRVFDDVRIAAKVGADAVVVDGMEGGTGASPDLLLDHTGIPTLAAIVQAREALEEVGLFGKTKLIVAGGIRNGVDAAKAIALGADAVYIGTAALIALGCNAPKPEWADDYTALGTRAGRCHHCHTGRCPAGITTQTPELEARLDIEEASDRVFNFISSMVMETTMLAKACGKGNVHSLDPSDLRALTVDASLMGKVPLAGLDRVPYQGA